MICVMYSSNPANIYLFNFSNENSRKRCDICSKLIKTPENIILVFLLLTLNIFCTSFLCFHCWTTMDLGLLCRCGWIFLESKFVEYFEAFPKIYWSQLIYRYYSKILRTEWTSAKRLGEFFCWNGAGFRSVSEIALAFNLLTLN